MARLNWKSDALATVVRPLPKGTGDPPKRHLRGNNLKTRIEISDSGFFLLEGVKQVIAAKALIANRFPFDRFNASSFASKLLTITADNRLPT